jgi:hypothetical protein
MIAVKTNGRVPAEGIWETECSAGAVRMGHAGVSFEPPAWPLRPQRRFADNDRHASHPHRP